MLHITESTKTLRKELRVANNYINDIISVFANINSKDNLTEKIGKFVINMPEFKVLARDSEMARLILRKVCTGEINIVHASEKLIQAQDEIHALQNALDSYYL